MLLRILQSLLLTTVYVLAFDDIYVNGEVSQEMVDKGRTQYQLLKERGTLPQYGTCWKSAVAHVDDGCKYLSEETQSDIALYLTNCFLEMSGHETYKCNADKKPNLRAICISNMSDRAFNVYTEFYTHTQNMCWFLRGQIWHETISDNTFKVGKQLEMSAKNQEHLLKSQKESIQVQEEILKHGKLLDQVLEDLYISTKAHQEILEVLSTSLKGLQNWLVGEVSWFESVIFYVISGLFAFMLTSAKRTSDSRFIVLFVLFINVITERLICVFFMWDQSDIDTQFLYKDIYLYVWWCRYLCIFSILSLLVYRICCYRDLMAENYKLLLDVSRQNSQILSILEGNQIKLNSSTSEFDVVNESNSVNNNNGYLHDTSSKYNYKQNCDEFAVNGSPYTDITRYSYKSRRKYSPKPHLPFQDLQNGRYNLRSKQNTPELS